MLTSLWRTLYRGRRKNESRQTEPSGNCVECEYSFYNHEANLPFDQIEECLRARRDALMQEHPPLNDPMPRAIRPRWAGKSSGSG
ncbi:hypothetical protein DZA65_02631 [Dickeya dianthicola]|uniref:Uncharacterized protein n=1 Tax=Dickeya dianthicola TaxID=204039 RepID=A0AAP6VDX8_9GAMM|nr:hypothetical protein [Dickeya dianthicola]ATO33639.1 hypothetical protein DDI_2471 [Dickeya dianthicola RNS04.9]AYC19515.1 hypothetical protein DZA65_02631 [Dickeya dianthicola]MBI0437562.1 hypothetical protein [Dickeya dianthicola]MBI0447824.1 hypothetical protein [Dickeya dianthicola]MBI0452441.1 hypothetical protein [Dickeya dianthicola]